MKGFKNTTRTKYETGGKVVAPPKGSETWTKRDDPAPLTTGKSPLDPSKIREIATRTLGTTPPPKTGKSPLDPSKIREIATRTLGTTPPPKTRTPIKPGQPKPVPHPTVINPVRPGRPVINPNPPGKPATPVKPAGPPMPLAPTGGPTPLPTPRGGYSKGGSAKKGVPAHSSKPMIGRKSGGLSVMPKGKC